MLSGNAVQYVGSQQSGNMIDNYNEGHPGAIITQIASYAKASLPDRPNVVLLMAGTNDVNIPSDPADAPVHLASLIDEIITTCPDAAILVAQLTPVAGAASEALAQTFNAAVPGIVASRVSAGHSVLVVDMTNYVTVKDLADGLHPNDVGYNLMAQAWYAGIQKAAANGWINAPVASGIFLEIGGSCTTKLYWDPFYGQIASGVGHGDATFVSGWLPGGTVAGGYVGTGNYQGAGVRLADLNGDGKDDYAWVDPVTGAITLDLNGGYTAGSGVNWIYKGVIASGIGDGPGVLFADINGDGLDDYLWVAPNGDVTAYKNGGENTSGGWLWYPLGVIVTGLGGTRATTRFADIDGDGRAEYLIVGPTGSLTAWFNSGFTDTPAWKFMGEIATGVGDAAGVYLEDLNNDGRADYIWLDSVGAATVYINYRGAGAGLAPEWVPTGVVATGVGTSRDNITFGDMNGDGKKDYVFIHVDSGKLDVWFNTGTGGTYVTGDGIRFADMNGDGRDDYLFMDTNGAITLYINNGYSSSAGEWIWVPQGVVASGIAARKDIR
jgi:lysophospholipase L1-like esterase